MNSIRVAIAVVASLSLLGPLPGGIAHLTNTAGVPSGPDPFRWSGTAPAQRSGVSGFYVAAPANVFAESSLLPIQAGDTTLFPEGFVAIQGMFCDAEVLSDGDASTTEDNGLDETRVDGAATAGNVPDGSWDDGGVGGACHAHHYNTASYNTLGCSGTAHAEDLALGPAVWIGAACDWATFVGPTSTLVPCVVNAMLTNPADVGSCATSAVDCAVDPGCQASAFLTCGPDGVADGINFGAGGGSGGIGVAYPSILDGCTSSDGLASVFVSSKVRVDPFGGSDVAQPTAGWIDSTLFTSAPLVRLQQLNWFNATGSVAQENSTWGQIEWAYQPLPLAHQYLNVVVESVDTQDPVWVIQNLPLLGAQTDLSTRQESTFFDLGEVGVSNGEDVTSLEVATVISPVPLDAAPEDPAFSSMTVGSTGASPTDSEDEAGTGSFDVGTPDPVKQQGPAVAENKERDIRSVQEGTAKCSAGSMARSIDWLNREYKLGMAKNAQQIYDDLIDAGVGKPNADRTKAREKWIKAKDTYAKAQTGGKIVTKVWDAAQFLDPIDGVAEENATTIDFADWLKREVKTEDIEISYSYPGGAHIVTVVAVVTDATGKVTSVKYRDDEKQGDNAKGDSTVKTAKIDKDANGRYTFGAAKNKITFAISESPKLT